jgi:peptidoglycan/xylan/chitin deacetylase (PgdA/CDA1 family)
VGAAQRKKYHLFMSLNRRQLFQAGALAAAASFIDLNTAENSQAAQIDITHGSRSSKNVALTFHGAGDPSNAHALLKIFADTKTPVTVFAIGTWLKANPTFAKLILAGGHDIGNHTLNHYEMKTLSAKKVDSEIAGCAAELKKQIGYAGSWFRASGTQYATPLIRKAAAKYGYNHCISYEVDSKDYLNPGKAAVISNTMAGIQNGSIVSLHFGHKNTVEALPALIEKLHANGFTPVTLTTLLGKI